MSLRWGFTGVLFQSHNGAIAANRSRLTVNDVGEVSIPQWCDCCAVVNEYLIRVPSSFNPTMVRLLRDLLDNFLEALVCFNPTMVRLLHADNPNATAVSFLFQSHNGAIAASCVHDEPLRRLSFNPTMVRLLLLNT